MVQLNRLLFLIVGSIMICHLFGCVHRPKPDGPKILRPKSYGEDKNRARDSKLDNSYLEIPLYPRHDSSEFEAIPRELPPDYPTEDGYLGFNHIGAVPSGCRLYTYVLFPRKYKYYDTTDLTTQRYLATLYAIWFSQSRYLIQHLTKEPEKMKAMNLFCIPCTFPDSMNTGNIDQNISNILCNVVARDEALSSSWKQSLMTGEGPFLISVIDPLDYKSSYKPSSILIANLSDYNPETIELVIKEYRKTVFFTKLNQFEEFSSFKTSLLDKFHQANTWITCIVPTINFFGAK